MLTMLCDCWISCTRHLQSLSSTPLYDCMKHIAIKIGVLKMLSDLRYPNKRNSWLVWKAK